MIKQYLKEKQQEIDHYLETHLPQKNQKPGLIFEAVRYSVFAGGKRIRPILSLMVNEMFAGSKESLFPAACAIEMIHTYSLIHDDLPAMDNDDFRRGKPSNHKQFGEAIAILAGDALLNMAFEWIANMDHQPQIIISILREISNASGAWGMIGGQVADLEAEGRLLINSDKDSSSQINHENELDYIHKHKTAALIKAPVVVGALNAEVSESEIDHCQQFGTLIGLAFQVTDDILDIEGDQKTLGKSVGKDIESNKLTYPALYGLENAKNKAKVLIEQSKDIISSYKNNDLLMQLADLIINRKS